MKMSLTIALFVVAGYQPATLLLDLANEVRSTDEEYFAIPKQDRANDVMAVGAGSHGQQPPIAPFEIVAMQFDRASYTLGETFQCQLTLRHTGLATVMFPVETRMHLFRRTMPTLQVAAVQMSVDSPSSSTGWRTQFQEQLYGAADVSSSLRPLAPNATVEIHTTGRWRFTGDAGSLTWPVEVHPRLMLHWSVAGVSSSPTRSTSNEPTIVLSRP